MRNLKALAPTARANIKQCPTPNQINIISQTRNLLISFTIT